MKDRYEIDLENMEREAREYAATHRVDFTQAYPIITNRHWLNWSPCFEYVTPTGRTEVLPGQSNSDNCGCLTVVHAGNGEAWTPELTRDIRADPYLPIDGRMNRLQAARCAEWQRTIDRVLGRDPNRPAINFNNPEK